MSAFSRTRFAVVLATMLGLMVGQISAAEPNVQASLTKGADFLAKSQAADGSFSSKAGVGVTAICATAMMRAGRSPSDPAVAKALKFLEANIQPDGGIYGGAKSFLKNYETCVSVLCLNEANKDKKYDKAIKDADKYLRGLQIGGDKSDVEYGGVGYGGKGRPDLSNTAFLIEALTAAGAGPDDKAIQDALIFVSRCQNLESPHNTTANAGKINDGGFYYTLQSAGANADPKKGEQPLRSYGSMSYAGFKSMLYAGLKPDDQRVKAVTTWLKKNYDVKSNPGQGDAGLFYYYNLMAKALHASGEDKFVDEAGKSHDWRKEIIDELVGRQKEDGSWVNTNRQFMENDPNLATAFALLVLAECAEKK